MKEQNNNFLRNVEFVEEVDPNVIYKNNNSNYSNNDNYNYNDVILVKKSAKVNVLVSIAIVFIVIAVLLSFMGFYLLYNSGNSIFPVDNNKYDLFVTHSSSNYGGEIKSFEGYDSLDKAYSYVFSVQNNNAISLNYDVELENISYFDGVNYSLINYSLLNFDNEVANGFLNNNRSTKLLTRNIGSNISDNYTLKLWSSEFKSDYTFCFKINVNV